MDKRNLITTEMIVREIAYHAGLVTGNYSYKNVYVASSDDNALVIHRNDDESIALRYNCQDLSLSLDAFVDRYIKPMFPKPSLTDIDGI